MGPGARLLESGRLAIVPGVGYPNPNRSHFESMAISQTARFGRESRQGLGWLGRALDDDRRTVDGTPAALRVGASMVEALWGRRSPASALTNAQDFLLHGGRGAKTPLVTNAAASDLQDFVKRNLLDSYAAADRMSQVVRLTSSGSGYPDTAYNRPDCPGSPTCALHEKA